ncbi:MAG: YqaE/Pmp3 family membrane protein [Saprospiraceae bacterium]
MLIAILAPPIAMLLYDGLSGRFWLSLLLTILLYLPGLIYTLIVILED